MGNSLNKASKSSERAGAESTSNDASIKKPCNGCKCKDKASSPEAKPVVEAPSATSHSPVMVVGDVDSATLPTSEIPNTTELVEEAVGEAARDISAEAISEEEASAKAVSEEDASTKAVSGEEVSAGAIPEKELKTVEDPAVDEDMGTEETALPAVDNESAAQTDESTTQNLEFSIADRKLKLSTAQDVQEHVEFIKANPQLKVIALNGNTFGVDAAKALAEAINTLEDVEEFYLNDGFTGRMKEEVHLCVEAFAQVLKTKPKLTKVDFSDNAFGPVGAKAVAVLLSGSTSLSQLILNNNGLGPEGGRIIAQALVNVQKTDSGAGRSSSLRRLEIGRNRLENGSSELMSEAFRVHGLLEEISLPQNGIRPEGVVELSKGIAASPNLIKLNMQDNTFTTVGSTAFATALTKLSRLQTLNIGDCLLGSQGCNMIIDALAATGCSLESLNLQYNEMNEEGVRNLINKLDKLASLKVLMLNGNNFNPVGEAAAALNEVLEQAGRRDILDSWSDMEWYSEDDEDDEDDEEEGEKKEEEEEKPHDESLMEVELVKPEASRVQDIQEDKASKDLAEELAGLEIKDQ